VFLSNASVRRPIAMGCLIIALSLLGFNAYRKINLELMPKMDLPYVTIVTVYPGASPEEIETDVAKRIEDAVVTIDGLKHVDSSCMENVCQTLLEFQLGVDVDIVATDVREKIDLIRADFPEDVEDPKIVKFDVNAKAIITMALTGDVPLDELYDFADNKLRDRITTISGVADVQLIGGARREVHVLPDRKALAARGLSTMDIYQAIQKGVRTIPSGRVRDSGTEYSVKFDADPAAIADIGRLELVNESGQRCRIKDIGRVTMTTEELRKKSFIDGRSCVAVKVIKKAEGNAVAVTRMVRHSMDQLKKEMPGGMELVWVTDDGRFTEATVNSAWSNVFMGVLLTAGILFVFLHNFRSLIVVCITMPITIVIGLFIMYAAGLTLNTSTMIAVGMSVGVLVTNSIVVLEAIVKHLDKSGDARGAARLGAAEAFIAVLASAGTNIVVLVPLAVMPSLIGMFIAPLVLAMLIMTGVSLFISFALTPLLCSVILKPRRENSRSLLAWMERGWNRGFNWFLSVYRRLLAFNERHRWAALLVLLAVLACFAHSFWVFRSVGTSMVEESDRGEIYVKIEFPTRYDLSKSVLRVGQAVDRLKNLPELRHVLSTIGKAEGIIGQASEGVYLAQIMLKFSDRDERTLTLKDLLKRVRSCLADYPEGILTVSVPTPIGGQSSDVEMVIAGDDLETLDALALQTQQLVREISGIEETDTTVRIGKPEMRIRPNRPVLADAGIPVVALGMTLRGNLEGLVAGTYKKNARNYDIVVKLDEIEGREQVEGFEFPGPPGHPVLLSSLANVSERLAPIQITRRDKRRVTKFLAILGDKALGTAVAEISEVVDARVNFPTGYDYDYAGVYEVMDEGLDGFVEAGIIAILLVVLTLAAILESFKQPVLILVTVPLALIGVFWALAITGVSLGIFVIMGVIMMVGIVVNNAILIMDQFNTHVAEGIPRHKAMITAACERFRPIVMITLAAVLGMLPMALGQGLGAEMRNGVGIATAGGIFVSGVLTLFVMPILYDLFTRKQKKTDA